jgi:hypothetical protein
MRSQVQGEDTRDDFALTRRGTGLVHPAPVKCKNRPIRRPASDGCSTFRRLAVRLCACVAPAALSFCDCPPIL